MAVKKIQIKPPDNNYVDVLHPETDSTMVLMGDGKTLEQFKTEHLAEKASLTETGHVQNGVYTTTLNTTWSGTSAPFSKAQTVTGILATDTPIIDVVMSGTFATDEARLEAWGYIYRAVTSANTITFYAMEKPTVELPLQIKVVR